MSHQDGPRSRRDFLTAATATIAAGALGSLATPATAAQNSGTADSANQGRPRIGCTSWVFHDFKPGTDPTEAIEQIGRLGFEGIELILLGRNDITDF